MKIKTYAITQTSVAWCVLKAGPWILLAKVEKAALVLFRIYCDSATLLCVRVVMDAISETETGSELENVRHGFNFVPTFRSVALLRFIRVFNGWKNLWNFFLFLPSSFFTRRTYFVRYIELRPCITIFSGGWKLTRWISYCWETVSRAQSQHTVIKNVKICDEFARRPWFSVAGKCNELVRSLYNKLEKCESFFRLLSKE